MWAQYRKTLIPTQLLIVVVCLGLWHFGELPGQTVGFIFCVMQVGALLGAWWGVRLRKQLQDADERLPLDKD